MDVGRVTQATAEARLGAGSAPLAGLGSRVGAGPRPQAQPLGFLFLDVAILTFVPQIPAWKF